jgi:hypothetical protein
MCWQFSKHVLITPIEPEAVLLNTASGDNYVLNPLGLVVCALIQEGCNQTSLIIEQVSQHFPDDVGKIPDDVQEFMVALHSEGLIERVAQID